MKRPIMIGCMRQHCLVRTRISTAERAREDLEGNEILLINMNGR
jgi:hypothetical protein